LTGHKSDKDFPDNRETSAHCSSLAIEPHSAACEKPSDSGSTTHRHHFRAPLSASIRIRERRISHVGLYKVAISPQRAINYCQLNAHLNHCHSLLPKRLGSSHGCRAQFPPLGRLRTLAGNRSFSIPQNESGHRYFRLALLRAPLTCLTMLGARFLHVHVASRFSYERARFTSRAFPHNLPELQTKVKSKLL